MNRRFSHAEFRGSLYYILALGFSAPNARNLKQTSGQILEVLQKAESLPDWTALADRLKSLELCVNASDRSSLKAEYHRLFVGPYKLLAPPYASVYLEPESTIMGPSTLQVLRMYEEAGFVLSSSYKDLPDHIAAELEFMALLCEEEGAAWQRNDFSLASKLLIREETFLRQHLVRWIPNFTSKLLVWTDCQFYRALASLAQDYVLMDLDCVRALRRLLDAEGSATSMKEGARDGD